MIYILIEEQEIKFVKDFINIAWRKIIHYNELIQLPEDSNGVFIWYLYGQEIEKKKKEYESNFLNCGFSFENYHFENLGETLSRSLKDDHYSFTKDIDDDSILYCVRED